jgi:hypothetical protein
MNEIFKQLLENNLILENNPRLTELDIYKKAFYELDTNIKKIMNDYENKVEKDYNEIIQNLKTEQNRIIMALSML